MNKPIPTRSWWLSPPTYCYIAGTALVIGIAVILLKPEWRAWWPL